MVLEGNCLLVQAVLPLQLALALVRLSIIPTHGCLVCGAKEVGAFLAIAVFTRPLVVNNNFVLINLILCEDSHIMSVGNGSIQREYQKSRFSDL